VYVCSTRWTGEIDIGFFDRPLPQCGGKSIPNVFERLRPYVAKWRSARAFNPIQADLFETAPMSMNKDDIRVVELFAGVGGFRIGLERASSRFKTVWSNQWEPSTKRQDASIVYQRQFGTEGHSNEDIATVPTNAIPKSDLLVGGFPCQDYSVATTLKNSGGIEGKKGVLWWQIHRILRESKTPPSYLFLENVDRLLKSPASQRGRDFAIILASLADLGYAAEWRVINAADYGMPQRRRRTYIVAYRKNTQLFKDAKAAFSGKTVDWLTKDGVIAQAFHASSDSSEVSFAIEGTLPEVTEDFNKGDGKNSPFKGAGFMVNRQVVTVDLVPKYSGHVTTLQEIIVDEMDVPSEFFIDGKALEEWKYLKGPKSEMRKTPEGFEYHYSEGGMAFPDSLDKPSRTIITGEGGSSPSRFKHVILTPSGRYRRLIPLELERLNMFPDNHTEAASDGRRAFLMGNALVTGIVERIGKILKERM
jgi:DNA (cytosine-5)-methyltransferase 1